MKRIFSIVLLSCFFLSCNNDKNEKTKDDSVVKIPAPPPPINTKVEEKENPYVPVDVSPMDMSYYPVDYPKLKMAKKTVAPPLARVLYSRPHLQGRHIFKDLLKYGEPWRLGANECTEIELYKDAQIQDKKIKAGRYILYCIPNEDKWTFVLNKNIDCWCYVIDKEKDIARFDSPVTKTANSLEYFTMLFQGTANAASLLVAWDNVEVRLPISF